jgi:phosphoribosylamine--glycine ligase
MEKVGVLVVSYGAREVSIIDSLIRSSDYKMEIYVADKQRNPFNARNATKHVVIPDLNIEKTLRFVQSNKDRIDFGIVGPEKPIIEGIRNLIEKQTGIPIICPTKEYAIEQSKVQQRLLFEKILPDANPRFKIFNPQNYRNTAEVKSEVFGWLNELDNNAVVKPDRPAAGKGVGVWGDHFANREELFEHFMSNFQYGSVIIEEKVEGEESSFQAFSDGRHLVPVPDTRDYKRAFDDDKGPNTGGMGSYKDVGEVLPFLTTDDRSREQEVANRLFGKWSSEAEDKTAIRGVPLYIAFMHTGKEAKVLEINSRPGDPEIINILPIIKDDFVDVCFKILEGNLNRIEFERFATVVTYKVPPNYGEYIDTFPDRVDKNELDKPIDLSKAQELTKKYGDKIRVYPAAMEVRDGEIYALKSRAIGVAGIGEDIEEARQISLTGLGKIAGGALWNRTDIASEKHIDSTIEHVKALRRRQ